MKKSLSKKKEKRIFNLPFTFLALIFLVISVVFYGSVLKLNLLPSLYIIVFTIAEIFFTFTIMMGLVKRRKTITLNFVCLLIAIIISCVYFFAIKYTNATTKFLGDVFREGSEVQEYYVVVKNDSKFKKIEDLANRKIYLFKVEDDIKQKVSDKVKIEYKSIDSLKDLGDNLILNKEDAILVSSSQYDILGDEIENFKGNTKVIFTVIHEIKNTTNIEKLNSKYTIDNGIFNIYISGIDTGGSIKNVGRSDANIVATVNTKTHEILLTSIPRDYYVTLHTKKAKDKLTHSGIYGISETITTVKDLLDIDINYYVRVNFNTVIKLVDVLGGVDVHSDYNFQSNGYYFKKGNNHLNGKQALVFSRERYSFNSGDNQRIKNQQYVINGIIKKATSSAILTKYTSILNSLNNSFQTNIEQKEISKIVKNQLKDAISWDIKNNSLTGTGTHSSTYSMGSQKLYVMIPNSDSIISAKQKINTILKNK